MSVMKESKKYIIWLIQELSSKGGKKWQNYILDMVQWVVVKPEI